MKWFLSIKQVILLSVVITISYVFVMFQGGFVSWFIFYSILPFGLYSLILSLLPLHLWKVERTISQRNLIAGDQLEIELIIRRRFPFPISFIIVEDKSPGFSSNKTVLYPGFKRKMSYTYTIDRLTRGEHSFNCIKLTTSDFIGFVKKEIIYDQVDKILVYPYYQVVSLQQLGLPMGNKVDSSHFQKDFQSGLVAGIRDYQHGDRPSSIHWKATARRNELMTKEFEQPKTQTKTIWLNRDQRQSREGFEKSVSYTASLCESLIHQGEKVKLVSIGEEKNTYSFSKESNVYKEAFYHLAKVKSDCTSAFADVLGSGMTSQNTSGINIIVTSSLTEEFVLAVENSVYSGSIAIFVTNPTIGQQPFINRLRSKSIFIKEIQRVRHMKEPSEVKST